MIYSTLVYKTIQKTGVSHFKPHVSVNVSTFVLVFVILIFRFGFCFVPEYQIKNNKCNSDGTVLIKKLKGTQQTKQQQH
jgi:hypothetical protein